MRRFSAIIEKPHPSPKPKSFAVSLIVLSITLIKSSKCSVGTPKNAELYTSCCSSVLPDHLNSRKIDKARPIFCKIRFTNVYSDTKMIMGLLDAGKLDEALNLFDEMSVKDTVVWNLMIKGCLENGCLDLGVKLFDEMPERNVISWTTLIDGFLSVGRVRMAEMFFKEMPTKDIAAWNSMIHGYFCNGRVVEALNLFEEMPCRNVISWTSMIHGLDQHGRSEEGLNFFWRMMGCGVKPTLSTFSCVLTACANLKSARLGVQIHGHILRMGYLVDAYIIASLITFYANCKQIDSSCKVFSEKLHLNVVVWTALLTGHGLNCKHENALKVYGDMLRMGISPNQLSFTSALNSCCEMEALDKGKEVHAAVVKRGLETDVFVGNSLTNLYSNCGDINDGVAAFKIISEKNIVSWNSIIVSCAQHGCGIWALTLFSQMMHARVDPDEITLTGLLSACSRSGMLHKGRSLFEYFSQSKSMNLKLEPYACMVDILGRIGKLDEAEELIYNMPMKANLSVWLALLSGCRMHCNIEVAERSAKGVFDLDPHCSAAYVLLSNLYAFTGRWNDVAIIRGRMKKRGVMKQRGCSWVTLKGLRHEFVSGDRSHPLSNRIYEKLEWLGDRLKEVGYVPDQRFALHDVGDEQKESILSYHSERLAIGFALISTVEGSTITVMKNLRVCEDCHSAIKLIANIVGREIVLRDSNRFHLFRDGFCSCGDYW